MREIKLRWLLLGSFLSSVGMSFIWPLTSIYLHNRLGISLTVVGVVLLLNSLASVAGSYIAGLAFDRRNPYWLLVGGVATAMGTLILLIFFHGWPLFAALLVALGVASGWNLTLVNAIGTSIHHYDGRYVFNMLYFAQNLGVVGGTAIVGYVYHISVTLLFVIAAALFAFFLTVVATQFRPVARRPRRHRQRTEGSSTTVTLPRFNRWLLFAFFISLLIIWTMYQQWTSNLSVYMTDIGIPLSRYSILWTLNAGLIVAIQAILNWFSRDGKYLIYQIFFGIAMVALSFVVLIFAHSYPWFVLAMTVLTMGEATAFPAIPAMVNDLTPRTLKGRYQGMVNAWASAGRALGPLFGGAVIEATAYTTLFEIAAAAISIVFVTMVLLWIFWHHRLTFFSE
ncbi:MFS transporter [Schleiferilactobacillus perolens]|jgi:MFS family permease|uniref:MFS transporter n=1 Tax=Schleiferilactobacillus perolens TaxID=100468 RepID=UPI00235731CB|nr:MFS transporter [Schleiferilactobacillus perolens]MCI2171134.1 MFS transporter [Schleiferilactobacillus perolens]